MLCARWASLPAWGARLAASAARQHVAELRAVHLLAAQQQQQSEAAAAAAAAPPPERRQQPEWQSLSVVAATPTATQLLAAFFACELHSSDCYLLHGSVGAGKSYFSRAFIRTAADDDELPVPSPTFLLQNIYNDHAGPPIHHFDLYRLTEGYDLARLDLPASFSQAVSLVEWPERLALAGQEQQPAEPLEVTISILGQAEQAAVEAALAERRAAAASSSSSSGSGVPEAAGTVEDDLGSSSSGEDEEGGGDRRWRRIQLLTAGQRWQPRLQLLRRYLDAEGAEVGCYLDD
ncbi:tRNA threonylcarbamoyladenosine biosynthesis [Chlorella sorokiniana]|uniref:tRNA threonylcarbamoyladenosine biosynthesis protein TsaE n=1 Tax=Chlorella sorokiniana TaxID=3076 RepID=A0A2P6TB83_CHLSO|nr:tRNA threonylcarbamoyladenosine biosynthesis [Chlorella sorokiniana]|eukprot:PRW05813.1 tRNA threonylcarbamoyladenosine biosynthesis [Chlorella sorokiniana]